MPSKKKEEEVKKQVTQEEIDALDMSPAELAVLSDEMIETMVEVREKMNKEVAKLRKQHNTRKIYGIQVEDKYGIIKTPPRATVSKVMKIAAQQDTLAMGTIVLNDCWLQGDSELMSQDDYNISACLQALAAMEIRMGSLVKK